MGNNDWQPPPGWGEPDPSGAPSPVPSKPLYRKKRVILPSALLALLIGVGSFSDEPSSATATSAPVTSTFIDSPAARQAAEQTAAAEQQAAQQRTEQAAAAQQAQQAAAAQQLLATQRAAEQAAATEQAAAAQAQAAAAAAAAQATAERDAATRAAASAAAEQKAAAARRSTASSSDGDTYTNVDGDEVQRPVQAPGAPSGASAQCRDGSYSFSKHRSGTCSGHGGVAAWL